MKFLFHSIWRVFLTTALLFAGKGFGGDSFTVSTPGKEGIAGVHAVIPQDGGLTRQTANALAPAKLARHPDADLIRALRYLDEALFRMTGHKPNIGMDGDFSTGIVLATLKEAPGEWKADPAVREALGDDAVEAFYIRSEPERVVILANTNAGLLNGVVELLESVGYEVLGLGPNWVHVPDFRQTPLVFDVEMADRPDFLGRNLWATSGQARGEGTLRETPPDPFDESTPDSYERWRVGMRMAARSIPLFPGHSLQKYHEAVLDRMRETGEHEGFLVAGIHFKGKRPPASAANEDHLWISDVPGDPVFLSDGSQWKEHPRPPVSLDLSVEAARKVILDDLISKAEQHFAKYPDQIFVFGTDPEDGGGYAKLADYLRHPNWYPEYLAAEGVDFGKPYALDGFLGLDQPKELWDPAAASDTVFGFNNWLLREFDKWVDSQPDEKKRTTTGHPIKERVRCSLYSYNFHDVPPNFNLDPRIRVKVATFPKHRGLGKWKNFRSATDIASAFRQLSPREPSAIYKIISMARYRDGDLNGIRGMTGVGQIGKEIRDLYEAGIRSFSAETDFNFGGMGLPYWLYAKTLWHARLSAEELHALRDHWLQLAFGQGWREMKKYHDFLESGQMAISAPRNWGRAVQLLDAADRAVDSKREPDVQRRIDDLKQYWYYYYLVDTGEVGRKSKALREFVWKGQSSYMTSMHMVTAVHFGSSDAAKIAGPEFNEGPARYPHEETQAWWEKVRNHWPVEDVSDFASATLADGTPAKQVDLYDLVSVAEFGDDAEIPFRYNAGSQRQDIALLTTAAEEGGEIGCRLFWPWDDSKRNQRARDVFYGISGWNSDGSQWEELVDMSLTFQSSRKVTFADGKDYQMVDIKFPAPRPGTYRITVGRGGDGAYLASRNWNPENVNPPAPGGFTYTENLRGRTQPGVWVYIPKGTRSLDLEVWDDYGKKVVHLHNGLPSQEIMPTRSIDIGSRGTHRIPLEAGEDGSLVLLEGNGFAFPYLYSVPSLWAKTPSALLVPRKIAQADSLAIP